MGKEEEEEEEKDRTLSSTKRFPCASVSFNPCSKACTRAVSAAVLSSASRTRPSRVWSLARTGPTSWIGWVGGWVGGWVSFLCLSNPPVQCLELGTHRAHLLFWVGGWVGGWMKIDKWVGGWVGGWVKIEKWVGGWVGGWVGEPTSKSLTHSSRVVRYLRWRSRSCERGEGVGGWVGGWVGGDVANSRRGGGWVGGWVEVARKVEDWN